MYLSLTIKYALIWQLGALQVTGRSPSSLWTHFYHNYNPLFDLEFCWKTLGSSVSGATGIRFGWQLRGLQLLHTTHFRSFTWCRPTECVNAIRCRSWHSTDRHSDDLTGSRPRSLGGETYHLWNSGWRLGGATELPPGSKLDAIPGEDMQWSDCAWENTPWFPALAYIVPLRGLSCLDPSKW